MKRIYLGLVTLLLTSALRGEAAVDQLAKEAARQVCEQQVTLLEQLKTYVGHMQFNDKKDIVYQLNLLKACLATEETRLVTCSLEELADALRATELVIDNFEKNIPGQVAQVCCAGTAITAQTEAKTISAAEMLERYTKLQARIQALVKQVTELNMSAIDRLLTKTADLYNGQKEWLEPALAATTLATIFWQSENINNFIKDHKAACAVALGLGLYLRAHKRSTIAALKDKLPAVLYYPLAICKWAVGSHEKALRVFLPYGTDIDVAKVKTWVSAQEKLCGQPVVVDEDKTTAPFGFGNIARLIGMKNEVGAPFSFSFGPNGVAGSALVYQFPEKK